MKRTHKLTENSRLSLLPTGSGYAKKFAPSTKDTIANGGKSYPASSRYALNELTAQERNIAVLVSEGKTNSEIGSSLFIASGTVRNYVSVILSKLYLPNRAALAVYAVQNDLHGQAVKAYQSGPISYDPDCYKDILSMAIT